MGRAQLRIIAPAFKGNFLNRESDVIVILDPFGEKADARNRGLLYKGGRIASLLGGSLSALSIEPPECSLDALAESVKAATKETPPRLLLFAHTDRNSELAPLVAFHLDTAAVLDCRDIRYRSGTLFYVKHVYGGQFEQEASFSTAPEIATVSLESIYAEEIAPAPPFEVREIRPKTQKYAARKKTLATIPPDFRTVDIRYAKRILDIGSGCNQPALRDLTEQLSNLLESSIGTTKPVVDANPILKTRMIGQTGKTASPHLLLALGVSGSPHHVAGIRHADTILSVNSDERAPIFGLSDIGFVADLNRILPKLIQRIKRYRDKGLT